MLRSYLAAATHRVSGWAGRARMRREAGAADALTVPDPGAHKPGFHLPSPWIARFARESEFSGALAGTPGLLDVFSTIDDRLVASRHAIRFPAYCIACRSAQTMRIDWRLVGTTADGSVHPAWTETCVCESCGLNSRMRAVLALVLEHPEYAPTSRCYLAERVTASYPVFARHFASLASSEYLGPDRRPGEEVFIEKHATSIRHEDLTRLSFADASFDWVVTQDVFEHIPDYAKAFGECARVLGAGGKLVFSVPFDVSLKTTQIRARMTADGHVEHLLPPEIHGNPVSGDGALCFQNFGWDMLDSLRDAGFSEASAHAYWAPWLGHVGLGGFVFCATKAGKPLAARLT